jgi:hypothetical protein
MRRWFFLSFLLLPVMGCGGPYKFAPISGQVTLNGQPLANASITFQPEASATNNNPGPGSGAFTDADGRYTLKVIGTETRGAVVGKHKVRITLVADADSADDKPKRVKQLPGRYNAKTTLVYDVPAGGSSTADFPLTSP